MLLKSSGGATNSDTVKLHLAELQSFGSISESKKLRLRKKYILLASELFVIVPKYVIYLTFLFKPTLKFIFNGNFRSLHLLVGIYDLRENNSRCWTCSTDTSKYM